MKPVVNLPALSRSPARVELLVERRARRRIGGAAIDATAIEARPASVERPGRAYRARLPRQCGRRVDIVV